MSIEPEVLVLTKARFVEIDLERMAAIREKLRKSLAINDGLLSLTLWEMHSDPFAFVSLGHFSNEADSLAAWDSMLRSPVMDVVMELMSDPPNSLRFYVRSKTGANLDSLPVGSFCSVSTRIADLGFEQRLIDELGNIFEELKHIPGFLGGMTGQLTEVAEEVLGLAFWESKHAFEASLPKKAMYRIDLYQRVL